MKTTEAITDVFTWYVIRTESALEAEVSARPIQSLLLDAVTRPVRQQNVTGASRYRFSMLLPGLRKDFLRDGHGGHCVGPT